MVQHMYQELVSKNMESCTRRYSYLYSLQSTSPRTGDNSEEWWLTRGIMDPAKADDSLEPGPKQEAGPEQGPGAVHDQLAVPRWAVEAMLYRCHTDFAVVSLLLLPYSSGVGMHQEQREDLHHKDCK